MRVLVSVLLALCAFGVVAEPQRGHKKFVPVLYKKEASSHSEVEGKEEDEESEHEHKHAPTPSKRSKHHHDGDGPYKVEKHHYHAVPVIHKVPAPSAPHSSGHDHGLDGRGKDVHQESHQHHHHEVHEPRTQIIVNKKPHSHKDQGPTFHKKKGKKAMKKYIKSGGKKPKFHMMPQNGKGQMNYKVKKAKKMAKHGGYGGFGGYKKDDAQFSFNDKKGEW